MAIFPVRTHSGLHLRAEQFSTPGAGCQARLGSFRQTALFATESTELEMEPQVAH
jgi:hypothetical protein